MLIEKKAHALITAALIFTISAGIHIPFTAKMFANWDGPEFAFAMERYCLKEGFPAPPGHFLYIMTAKFINYFVNDHFSALLYLGLLFNGLICAALFLAARKIFSLKAGIISVFIYLASPLFWFYSNAIVTYTMCGFLSLVTGYFIFEVLYKEQEKYFVWASACFALMIGSRPQDLIFILPLWAWGWFKVKTGMKILSLLTLIATCLMWFLPFIAISGGINELINFFIGNISSGSSRLSRSVFNIPGLLTANLKYQIITYILTFGLGILPFFYYLPQFFNLKRTFSDKRAQIMLVWIMPSLLFWSIYKFSAPGYIITSLLPMVVLLAEFLNRMSYELAEVLSSNAQYLKRRSSIILIVFVSTLMIGNLAGYFCDFRSQDKYAYADDFRSYPDSKKRDAQLSGKIQYIKQNIDADNSAVFVSASDFMPAMYYLSDYHIYLVNPAGPYDKGLVKHAHNFKRNDIGNFNMREFIYSKENQIKQIVFFDDNFDNLIDSKMQKQTITVAGWYSIVVAYP